MASTVIPDQYQGIRSRNGLDMYVSGSHIMRLRILMSIRIADSEPIAVRVSVEANQKTWHLPKKLLTTKSTFFATALYGGFAGQDSKTVTLPEVRSEDFEKLVRWLYLGELHFERNKELELHEYKELVHLWNLGDMLGCPMFQDALMRLLLFRLSEDDTLIYGMSPEVLAFIWDACVPCSKLRKFAIDQCIVDVRMGRFTSESMQAYIQFAEDNEDFARAYAAASIRNGKLKREYLWDDRTDYFSSPQSNT